MMPQPAQKWLGFRNLAHRPPTPSKGRGSVQRRAKRAMIALGGIASTSQVLEWTACRKRVRGERADRWDCRAARRALEQLGAERVGRVPPYGAVLWRLRNTDDTDTP
jgi:hypothetical protein